MTEQQRKTIEAVRNAHARRADANRVGRGHAAIVVALDAALAPQSPAAPVPVEAVLTPKDLRRAVELAGEDHAKGVGDFLHHYHPDALVRVGDLVELLNDVHRVAADHLQNELDAQRGEEAEAWKEASGCDDPEELEEEMKSLEKRLAAYEED